MTITTKYRPTDFSEVFGQDVSVRILQNSIRMDRVPKGILFSGTRGSGKTTLARIYAKSLNCLTYEDTCCKICNNCLGNLDLIEIDAASNNGVDDMRQLSQILSTARLGKYRVVILDECHYLSGSAQAAFLKLLEEPPENTVFLLVTTNPEKLERTISSRCLSMPLSPIKAVDVYRNISWILEKEGLKATDGFLWSLSNSGLGSLRDIQQILEQAILYSNAGLIDEGCLIDIAGIIPCGFYKDMAAAICSLDLKYFLEEVNRWYSEGRDLKLMFIDGLSKLFRDFMIYLTNSDVEYYSGIPQESLKNNLTLDLEMVMFGVRLVGEMDEYARNTNREKILWEVFGAKFFEGLKCGEKT